MTINLPDVVLLEIFDRYRHTFGDQLSSERAWNNKNGWFKLAHVCHSWRSVVLASPSRLRLRLYFTSKTPTRAVVLERLSHLPIIVNYSKVSWKGGAQKRLVSALRYPDRVCRIALSAWWSYNGVTEVLDRPFPALESLELDFPSSIECVLQSPSFMSSIQFLRHLRLDGMSLTSVSPLLSITRSLVDLTLDLDKVFITERESLLTHLQHMPHLRNLEVYSHHYPIHPTEELSLTTSKLPPTTSILLPELTGFRFVARHNQAECFVAGLDTPSLRDIHISIANYSHKLQIPHLTKLIRAVGVVFVTAQLTIDGGTFRTDLFARPHSIDGPPPNIFSIRTPFLSDSDIALSAMLTTIEDIYLFFPNYIGSRLNEKPATWRKLFGEFCNVKVLRILHGLEEQVIEMLRQPMNTLPPQEADPDATIPFNSPIITNGSQFITNIFPSLEEIVLYEGEPNELETIGEMGRASMLELFGPFVTARHELGCPVKVLWSTDGYFPRYFTTALAAVGYGRIY
jgi:F-box-like